MYCSNCGQESEAGSRFCSACGKAFSDLARNSGMNTDSEINHGGSIGYSVKINDPAFARYVKHNNQWSAIFALILATAAIIGFYIAGEKGSELDNPQALYIGFAIGGMFLLIALFQILGRKRSKDWDGIVVDKQISRKKERYYPGGDSSSGWYWRHYLEYAVIIQDQNGKIHKLTYKDEDIKYNYFELHAHVRHHGALNSFEKYDKSKDSIVFCNACGYLNEIKSDNCVRCKCPLLK